MNTSQNYKPQYNRDYVSRVFNTRDEADSAYNELEKRGYSKNDINVLMSDHTRDTHFNNDNNVADTDLGNKVAENAGTGSLIGGGIGAAVGAIAAIGSNLLLPGLGLVIAGPLAAGLAGAGAGAATGGIIGALTGVGVPEDDANRYKKDIEDGGIYMGFKPNSEDDAKHTYDSWYDNYDRTTN